VRLGIAAGLVLADPKIEPVAGHRGFDPPVARRAAIIERQIAVDDVLAKAVLGSSGPTLLAPGETAVADLNDERCRALRPRGTRLE
jgi:hypothetical protein